MAQFAFFFDGSRCTGCKTCVLACKDGYSLGLGISFRKVYECVGGETRKDEHGTCTSTCFAYYLSLGCNHCLRPVCVEVCPTQAMHKSDETGLVSVDVRKCIGCGYCHLSCPYNAPAVDKNKGHSVKCEGCKELVREGRKPLCVMACPARALDFGSAEAMAARGARADVAPLPDPAETVPGLYIKPCESARPAGSGDVRVANIPEVLFSETQQTTAKGNPW